MVNCQHMFFLCFIYIYIHSWISSRFCHGGTPSHPVVTGCFNTTCHGPWLGGLGVPPWLWKNLHVFITKKIEMWICWNDYPLILLWTIYSVSIWVLILRVYPQNIASSEGKIMINQWIYIEYPVFRQTHRISSNDNKTMNLLKKLENDRVFFNQSNERFTL